MVSIVSDSHPSLMIIVGAFSVIVQLHQLIVYITCIYDLYLESIGEESVVEESVGDDELDHDNDEVEELTENETTKVNIVSEMKMFHQS